MMPGAVPVVAIVGPTAAGKSDLAVALAHRIGGEVVNADSMQLYRGMDIGTAKLTEPERGGVAHHVLDVWEPTYPADVASYQQLARAEIDRLLALGRIPLVVGGSGLYVRAALDAIDFPGTDPALRAQLEQELEQVGPQALHARLAAADARAAAAILPGNGRRIVRALEVIALTGEFAAELPEHRAVYDVAFIGVDRPDLDERIGLRTERIWQQGFVDEVRGLEAAGLRSGRTAPRALGYAQVLAWLSGELADEAAAKAETVRATRRFVKRQRSWFRRDPRITWLGRAGAGDSAENFAEFGSHEKAQVDAAERLIAGFGLR